MDQPNLFDPGPVAPDPWKLHPDDWIERPDIVFHASEEPKLPRKDRGPGRSVGYGGSEGMHFGDKGTALDRALGSSDRHYIHSARLNAAQFPNINNGPWSDKDANYSEAADDAVGKGFVIPYHNNVEGQSGNISYRAKAESVRTWSEDVQDDPTAHPALKHLASVGYNPTVLKREVMSKYNAPLQPQLFEADLVKGGTAVAHGREDDMFDKMSATPPGSGLGVRRNNLRPSWNVLETANNTTPALRPSRNTDPRGYTKR